MEEEAAAAAAGTAFQQQLCDEATCSICLDYFKDPVMIAECGHNFCKTCLDLYWGKPGSDFSCPQCRLTVERRNVIPNRTLANFVEIAKKSNPPGETGVKETWSICGKHQEPQKLFCRDDKTPICVVCDKSKEHENHKVIPVEEAVEGYEKQIRSYLEDIRLKMEKVLECKTDTNQKSQGLLEKIKKEREKTVTVFKQIHQFLEEQEHLLLDEMEEAIKEIEREQESHIAKLGEELQSLEGIVQETEKRLQQSASHLLQDIEIFLERCAAEKYFENSPISFRAELKLKIWDFCDINPFLEQVMKQFKGTLGSGLRLQKANVHLDLDTAHPQLMVSEDSKSVMWTETYQDLPDNPERFNEWPFVLGCEEFTAGRHFWEVAVESEDGWHLGVARKTLKRKGHIRWGPHGGIWAIGKRNAGYWSCVNTPLFLDEEPRKIRVVLNCEGGRVSFYDADRGTLIHNCSEPVFSRETLHPFCDLSGNVNLTLSS